MQADRNIVSYALERINTLFNAELAARGTLDVMHKGTQYTVPFKPCTAIVALETTPAHINITLQHSDCQCGILGQSQCILPLVTWQLSHTHEMTCITNFFVPGPLTRALMEEAGKEAFAMLRVACSHMQPVMEASDITVFRAWTWAVQ